MLLVQKYLDTHTFGDLAKEHGVYASFSKSGHKFSLNYDQIEAKESDPLAQECRGLILCLADHRPVFGLATTIPGTTMPDGKINRDDIEPGETRILAYPMKRFFNHGQGAAAEINWKDPKLAILEKLDGTLCIVYYDSITTQWCVATRAVPEADLPMDNGKYTFRTLFEKALKDTMGLPFEEFVLNLDKSSTYCFELTTPYNRIVVNYPESRVTLLAVRNLRTLKEIDPRDDHTLEVIGLPIVKSYTFNNIEDIHNYVSNQNPLEHEGVVVRDSNFNRLKVKNASYVAFNRAREVLGASDRNCLELILAEKDDDVIPALPQEIVDNLLSIKSGYKGWLNEQEELYKEIYKQASNILPNDKKTFAITLQKYKVTVPGSFFAIFDGKASSVKDFIAKNRREGTWPNGLLDKILEALKPFALAVAIS